MTERIQAAAMVILATAAAAVADHRLMRQLHAERADQLADEARREPEFKGKERGLAG